MNQRRTNSPFLNGVPELLILHHLDRKPMHGYELVHTIRASSGDAFEFGEGCIYPILHRLEAARSLATWRQTVGGRDRIIYRLTDKGRQQLAESVTCWKSVAKAVCDALRGGADDGHPAMA